MSDRDAIADDDEKDDLTDSQLDRMLVRAISLSQFEASHRQLTYYVMLDLGLSTRDAPAYDRIRPRVEARMARMVDRGTFWQARSLERQF